MALLRYYTTYVHVPTYSLVVEMYTVVPTIPPSLPFYAKKWRKNGAANTQKGTQNQRWFPWEEKEGEGYKAFNGKRSREGRLGKCG